MQIGGIDSASAAMVASIESVVTGLQRATVNGPSFTITGVIRPADTVRLVINDFMYTGGDGYTVLTQGTNVQQPGDDLLEVAVDYVTSNSPVGPLVEGRITTP